MTKHNKLVRDRIPEIIRSKGQTCVVHTLTDEQHSAALKVKLREEVEEYLKAPNDQAAVEELADILEVVHALCRTHGVSVERLNEIREEKHKARGGFDNKVFLVESQDV